MAHPASQESAQPESAQPDPTHTDILNWDEEDFKSATQNTALNRPKQRGLVRNAIVVLGNQAQATALPLLRDHLDKEAHPMVLDALYWAIDQIERNQTDDARSNG